MCSVTQFLSPIDCVDLIPGVSRFSLIVMCLKALSVQFMFVGSTCSVCVFPAIPSVGCTLFMDFIKDCFVYSTSPRSSLHRS